MKEVVLYTLVVVSGLVVLGYSIHMIIGGLVTEELEYRIIAVICLVGFVVMGLLVRDVIRHRKKASGGQ